ncbi:Stp1/IreP family PP2C-type Ser/Thr phosphatase [Bacteriovoracaceae bacterium]|nr:Stp1/IreP family PP2C-type Ser/Thr phosphatase [Bacteriovoracaceae bacterium]
MSLLSAGVCDIGRVRKSNQDSICLVPDKRFFAVADGMGGHNGGDIASKMATDLLGHNIQVSNPENKREFLFGLLRRVNDKIYQTSLDHPELQGMGTTLTGIYFDEKHLNIFNIGDSRVYLVNDQQLYQLTRDHSLIQEKLNLGIYDREMAHADKQKNVLVKSVGFEPKVEADIFRYRYSKNDMFLICSDGLHGKVSDRDILFLVNNMISSPLTATSEDLNRVAKKLVDQANHNGGQDNISVILVLIK